MNADDFDDVFSTRGKSDLYHVSGNEFDDMSFSNIEEDASPEKKVAKTTPKKSKTTPKNGKKGVAEISKKKRLTMEEKIPTMTFADGLKNICKYNTVKDGTKGRKLRCAPVLIDWIPASFFYEKKKAKIHTKVEAVINAALFFLNKPQGLEEAECRENVNRARIALATEVDPEDWGFSILDLIGVDTYYGHVRLIISWKERGEEEVIETKIIPPSILKKETFWLRNTVSLVGQARANRILGMMDDFVTEYSDCCESQKTNSNLVTKCWPKWKAMKEAHKCLKTEGKEGILLSSVRSKRKNGEMGGDTKICLIPLFPPIFMNVIFSKYKSKKKTIENQLHTEALKKKRKEGKASRKKIDPKSLLPTQNKGKRNIKIDPKSLLPTQNKPRNSIKSPPTLGSSSNSGDDLDVRSKFLGSSGTAAGDMKKLKENASLHASQQIKTFLLVGPPPAYLRQTGKTPHATEEDILKDVVVSGLSLAAGKCFKTLHKAALDHFTLGKEVRVVEPLSPGGVGAFVQNFLTFTKRCGTDDFGGIHIFPKYNGPNPLTECMEETTTIQKRKNGNHTTPNKEIDNKVMKPAKKKKKKKKSPEPIVKVVEQPAETPKKAKRKIEPKTPNDKPVEKTIPSTPKKKMRKQEEKRSQPSPVPLEKEEKKKERDNGKRRTSVSIWDSFSHDADDRWKNRVQVIGKGQADKKGRISNLVKIIHPNHITKKTDSSTYRCILSEIQEQTASVVKEKITEKDEYLVAFKRKPKDCKHIPLLLKNSVCGYYVQEMFKGCDPVCLGAASTWVKAECSRYDLLRSPFYDQEKKEATRTFNGAQLILLQSLNMATYLRVRSRQDNTGFKTTYFILKPGGVAMFSKDMEVHVVGKKGKPKIPANNGLPEFDNSRDKYLYAVYMHVRPTVSDYFKSD